MGVEQQRKAMLDAMQSQKQYTVTFSEDEMKVLVFVLSADTTVVPVKMAPIMANAIAKMNGSGVGSAGDDGADGTGKAGPT